jgi:5'-nucleotidase/UDP-sugar diphosphatase
VPGPESEINTLTGDDAIKPYLVKEFPSGNRVGICGITVKKVTEQSSFADPGTTLMEERVAAEACVIELQAEGVDKIVILSHSGYSTDMTFTDIEGVDVVIGGHSHSLLGGEELAEFGFTTLGSYGVFQHGMCVVTAWEYNKVVGRVDVTFDAEGNVIGCEGGVHIPINPDRFTVRDADPRFDLEAADAQIAADFLLSFPLFANEGEDADIIAALQPFRDEIGERAEVVIAQVPETLCHTRGGVTDLQCPDKDVQSLVGGGVCPIVARGFLLNAPVADFAIQNAGGCRVSIQAGDFTFGGAYAVLPFSNTLVTLVMTGDQIRRVIEDAFNFFLEGGGGSGSFPVAAGLHWEVDYNKVFGERVTNMEMNIRLEEDVWTQLDMDASYTVVTQNFVATPRDGYFTFGEVDKTDPDAYVDLYIEYAQSLINFCNEFGVLEEILISEYPNQFIVFLDGSTADLRPLREVEATEEPAPEAVEEPTAAPPTSAAGVVSSTGIAGLVLASVSVLFL